MLLFHAYQAVQKTEALYSPEKVLKVLSNLNFNVDPKGGLSHTTEIDNGAILVNLDTARPDPFKVLSVRLDHEKNNAHTTTYNIGRDGKPNLVTSFNMDIETLTHSNVKSTEPNFEDRKDLNGIIKLLEQKTSKRLPPRPS